MHRFREKIIGIYENDRSPLNSELRPFNILMMIV